MPAVPARKKKRVIDLAQGGMARAEIAAKTGLSLKVIDEIRREAGLTMARKAKDAPAPVDPTDYDALLVRLRDADSGAGVTVTLGEFTPPTDRMQQAGLREDLLRVLKDRVKSPTKFVDAWLDRAARDQRHDDDARGQRLALEDPEPWAGPDPLTGSELLARAEAIVRRFVFIPEDATYAVLATWALYTWTFDLYPFTPYLWLTAPQKRSGKSRAQDVIALLSRRSLSTANASVSTLFRVVESATPTLFIDEVDAWLTDNEEARGILDSGFEQGKGVLRSVPLPSGEHETRLFPTYCPKCITGIGTIDATLADRSLCVQMRRKLPNEPVERFNRRGRQRLEVEAAIWRRQALRWRNDHEDELATVEPKLPTALHDRAQDIVEPLLAVAEVVGDEWPERVRAGALRLFAFDDASDEDAGILLLTDLAGVFGRAEADPLATATIIQELVMMTERPWVRWSARGTKPITPHSLARLLKPYGVGPTKIGEPKHRVAGYHLAGPLQDAIDRYVGVLSDPVSGSLSAPTAGLPGAVRLSGPSDGSGTENAGSDTKAPSNAHGPSSPPNQNGQPDRSQVDAPNGSDNEADRDRTRGLWWERETAILNAMAEEDLRRIDQDLTDEEWEREIADVLAGREVAELERRQAEAAEREPICPACGGFSRMTAEQPGVWTCEECCTMFTPEVA